MAIVCLIVFVLAIRAAIKAGKRKPRKVTTATRAAPDLSAKLAALDSLQAARRTTAETIDYIEKMFEDPDYIMKEKDVLYWLKQKASAEKQLAGIEKQIQNLIK